MVFASETLIKEGLLCSFNLDTIFVKKYDRYSDVHVEVTDIYSGNIIVFFN